MTEHILHRFFLIGVMLMISSPFSAPAPTTVRKPAVAGTFYEKNPKLLREVLLRYLADGRPLSEPVRLLMCPHAGFVFSGPVAAKGYATLDVKVERVVIIGPSHYKAFSGIAVPKFEFYETPLGKVPIDTKVVDRLRDQPGVIAASGFDEPEHCLEVQLPFLQVQLKKFSIVPVLVGKADPLQVAKMLQPFMDGKTAVIASSDLSHYKEQRTARSIDDTSIEAILKGDTTVRIDACGELPIRIVMALGKQLGLTPVKLDARTSFETAPQQCPESRVVGYAAIAWVSPAAAKAFNEKNEAAEDTGEDTLSPEVRSFLLRIARGSLEASVAKKPFRLPDDIPEGVKDNSGCFVTLTKNGRLRGCIGYIEPIKPLYKAVVENAEHAALNDPRFPKVTPEELPSITIEVSVLTKPQPLDYKDPADLLAKLVPGRDGVILRSGSRHATYLPQVWEQLSDKVAFLEQLSLKGGMSRDGWKHAEVKTYRALHFEE